jgi:hypothetical protein
MDINKKIMMSLCPSFDEQSLALSSNRRRNSRSRSFHNRNH